jgi:hypothetical protein
MELAALGNKVLVADGMEIQTPGTLRNALEKTSGYLTIGLETLAGQDAQTAAVWISKAWLNSLFRLGYSQVHDLVEKARSVRDRVSLRWIDRQHFLADTPLEETVRGLLRSRPLYFEGASEDNFIGFRNFSTREDIRLTAWRIEAANRLADFFENLHLAPEEIKAICLNACMGDRIETVRWSQVLHTLWARKALSGEEVFLPFSVEEITRVLETVFLPRTGGTGKTLIAEYVPSLLLRVNESPSREEAGPSRVVEEWIKQSSNELEDELGGLDPVAPIRIHYIQSLCVKGNPDT